eukprot:CAMPEP_0184486744 /NCGR_PEP_ID=MMETSP0113_2-20130426/8485_1 /TAXON_ID=91329 /ORGANISM="Norrisiella sphaerica, Strain BC52" /LENGTH=290 /DNA_ID=CAMNT_0026868761 /DNA_START=95 /DNA_END=967 /DNA_ORIENTATION=+
MSTQQNDNKKEGFLTKNIVKPFQNLMGGKKKDEPSVEDRKNISDKTSEYYQYAMEELEKMRQHGKEYAKNTHDNVSSSAKEQSNNVSAYISNVRERMGQQWDDTYQSVLEKFSKQADLSQEEYEKQKSSFKEQWNKDVYPVIQKRYQQAKESVGMTGDKKEDKGISDKANDFYNQAYEEIENMRKQGKDYANNTFKGAKDSTEKHTDNMSAYLENMRKRLGNQWDESYDQALKQFSKQGDLTKEEFEKQKKSYRESFNKDILPAMQKKWENAKSAFTSNQGREEVKKESS